MDYDNWSLYIILNRLLVSLMKKDFSNETDKLKMGLLIQEAIYPELSSFMLKKMLSLLSSNIEPTLVDEQTILKKELFQSSNFDTMVYTLEEREDNHKISEFDSNVILMQLCFSALKAFNIASETAFSAEVANNIEPFLESVSDYLKKTKVKENKSYHPYGIDCELMKLLKTFQLIPEASYLVERVFDLESEDNQVFDESDTPLNDIQSYLLRAKEYKEQPRLKGEAQKYVLEGVLPFIYKYINAVLNLTNFGNNKMMKRLDMINEVRSKDREKLWRILQKRMVNNTVHYNVETVTEIKFIYMEAHSVLMDIANRNDISMLYDEEGAETPSSKESSRKLVISEDPELIAEKKILRMVTMCNILMDDIEKFYKNTRFEFIIT